MQRIERKGRQRGIIRMTTETIGKLACYSMTRELGSLIGLSISLLVLGCDGK